MAGKESEIRGFAAGLSYHRSYLDYRRETGYNDGANLSGLGRKE